MANNISKVVTISQSDYNNLINGQSVKGQSYDPKAMYLIPSSGKYLPTSGGTMTGTINSRSIVPSVPSTFDLGSSSNKWSNVYATSFNENGTALSSKYAAYSHSHISLTNASHTLQVNAGGGLTLDGSTVQTGDTKNTAGATQTNTKLYIVGATSRGSASLQTYTSSGSTGVYMSASTLYATAFYEASDKRLKNVHGEIDLDKAYDLIDKCSTILYDLKDDESHKLQVGVIAQEVQEFFPEVISTDEDGMLSVDYSRLTVIIMRVLKDLIERVKKLEK